MRKARSGGGPAGGGGEVLRIRAGRRKWAPACAMLSRRTVKEVGVHRAVLAWGPGAATEHWSHCQRQRPGPWLPPERVLAAMSCAAPLW